MRTVAEKLGGRAAVVQVNSNENQTLAQRFGVRGIPVLYLLREGRVIAQLPGARNTEDILKWFAGNWKE